MSLTTKVLIALVVGMLAGLPLGPSSGFATSYPAFASGLLALLEPLGSLFVGAIRMTVIPLVVSSLVVGVSSTPDPKVVGRLGLRAIVLFLVVLAIGSAFGVLVGAPLIALFPLDPAAVDVVRASAAAASGSAAEGARSIPTLSQWIVALVPVNPVKAAADGAMLPLIVFSVAFSVALIRVTQEKRAPVVRFFEGVQEASLKLVHAILALAPIGVFALSVGVAAKMGLAAAGALIGYIAVTSIMAVLFIVAVLYPSAVVLGRVALRDLVKAWLPAQSIAFSSRSSLAALPAMLETAQVRLKLPTAIGSFFVPLAASTFRAGAGCAQTVGALFVARLYGVDLSAAQMLSIALTAVVTSFSVPGIPGGSIIAMVPVLMSAGIPIDGIGILLGADTVPDMFRTTTNVTGQMSGAVILARGEREGT